MEKEKRSGENTVEEEQEENAGGCEKKQHKTSKITVITAGKHTEKIRVQTAKLSLFIKRTNKLEH